MKLKLSLSFLFVFIFLFSNAQSNHYYYYRGQKVFITLDKSSLSISVFQNFQKSSLNTIGLIDYDLKDDNSLNVPSTIKYATVEFQTTPTDVEYYQKIAVIQNTVDVRTVYPNYIASNGETMGLSDYLYVKLKTANDLSILQQKAVENNLTIIEQDPYMPLWYILRCTQNTIGNSLQVANNLFETTLFSSAVPDLLTYNDLLCTNDPDFGQQWGLNNANSPSIDINACDAWTITEGNGVNVAVVDTGIEFTHNDLAANLSLSSYDSETGSSPSVINYSSPRADHGTHVAGVIGAIKNNNLQVAGVAPQCMLFSISNNLDGTSNSRIKLARGINWAVDNDVDIINNSWGSSMQFDVIDQAIENALINGRNGLGTILVFATGNAGIPQVDYPANSNPDILAVGAIQNNGQRVGFSNTGLQLDVVAPGYNILSTGLDNTIIFKNGTSQAAPYVSGVAALILSVNPCLTVQQVNNIIEQTAQKVGNYTYSINSPNRTNGAWNSEMGYGLLDAYAAVQMAQSISSDTLDLLIRDSPEDIGVEPNTVTQHMWTSEDIWIRNIDDNGLEHQNPKYRIPFGTLVAPNFIYVRVINKSCVASLGIETLTVNWAKASTALGWPENWDGSLQNVGNHPLGGVLPSVTIPILQAGEEAIVKIPWAVPNPDDYLDNPDPWHFCLLARIDSSLDPMGSFNANPNIMVRENNNQAWKNLTVIGLVEDNTYALVMVANPFNTPRTFFLELQKDIDEGGKPIYDEAEVTIKMDQIIYDAWERGGKQAQLIEDKQEEKNKLVKGDHVILDNIMFNANEMGLLTLDFGFLTKELTGKNEFKYHVIQKDATTGEVIGGETFLIKKNTRTTFFADAGDDKEIDENEMVTLSASQINEAALYNWYDSDGTLIYQGKDLTVSADIAKKYKLEIIAEFDGYKDYDEIEVKLKPSLIESLSPNPANNQIQVVYKLNGVTSAYIMVIGQYGTNNVSNNYALDVTTSQIIIDISAYSNGYYTVALICDGEIVDAKNLLKH